MNATIKKLWTNRTYAALAFYAAGIAYAVYVGLPLWMVLSGIACMAFWYAQENRKVVAFAVALAMVAFLAPGIQGATASAGHDAAPAAEAAEEN